MKEKSINSHRNVYDGIQQNSSNKVSDFPILAEMRKSCSLSHQRYKDDLEKKQETSCSIWSYSQAEGYGRGIVKSEAEDFGDWNLY